ncbi:Bro-N domain-containing protein [Chakrabartyella piscis]|uniref:BRO-N domain-containing protein n=1 Tax=Chakrabartyella piscis TaxID=2918914 RepID=UPI0029583A67|nr:Bro-N domain-containing protein [Chakrabartyella piscis]
MQELQKFQNEEFGEIRTITIEGNPWFVGKDVAEILGYVRTDNAIRSHVDDEDKLTHQFSASGQSRQMVIINESGLYSLVLKSKLPTAKAFKRWVTSIVIPFIRKYGGYVTEETLTSIFNRFQYETQAFLHI